VVTILSGISSQLALKQRSDQNKKAEEKKKELMDFIQRFSANVAKSKQATSRRKMIDKLNIEEIKPSTRKYPGIFFIQEREAGDQILSVDNYSYQLEGTFLFKNLSFTVNKGDKIVFLSKNPLAITKFFDCIYGNDKPASGTAEWGVTIKSSYIPNDNSSFFEGVDLSLVDWLRQFSKEKDETFIRGFLGKMLFSGEESLKKAKVLSGGEKVRCMMSKTMLESPNVMIVDEPTNHLDIESIQWLEGFLRNYPGCVVLVSHDKTFLDMVTNRTIEIANRTIYDFKCSYTQYVVERKIQRDLQLATKKNQEKEIEQTQALIDKFRAKANTAAFAQSLIKRLDKMEVIDVDEDQIAAMKFRFPDAPRSGLNVVEALGMTKRFGDRFILDNIKLLVERGQKVAFVGKNGMGKTTMGKMIVGEEPFEGVLNVGANVSIGYYAQHQAEKLNLDYTVLETIERAMKPGAGQNARTLLGAFLFSGDNVCKKVKVLSGGEKSRLSLAKLLLEEHNLLILDEPTNHLDMISIDVLKEAVTHFNGTLIVISHDRDFKFSNLETNAFANILKTSKDS